MVIILQNKIGQFVRLYLNALFFIIKIVIKTINYSFVYFLFIEMFKKQIRTLFNIYYLVTAGKETINIC